MRLLLPLILFFLASTANAMDIRGASVFVDINDGARDGCWTNLREVREYVEEKLYSRGAKITSDVGVVDNDVYRLYVHVLADRMFSDGTGPCFGAIQVRLDGLKIVKAKLVWVVFVEGVYSDMDPDNLNSSTTYVLNNFFREEWQY